MEEYSHPFQFGAHAFRKVIRPEGVICPEGETDLVLVEIVGLLSDDGVLRPGVRRAARRACHQPVPAPRRGASVDGAHGNEMKTTDEVAVEAQPHQTTEWPKKVNSFDELVIMVLDEENARPMILPKASLSFDYNWGCD